MRKIKLCFLGMVMSVVLLVSACGSSYEIDYTIDVQETETIAEIVTETEEVPTLSVEPHKNNNMLLEAGIQFSLADVPAYSGEPYVAVNNNTPYFSDSDIVETSFESYSDLDALGRCGVAYASVGIDIMPTEERGAIGQIKPSGWHTVKYDNVDGKYLYNRCHLIGYQLTAENANEKNLITGTRYLNIQGMLPFENMTADYIKETGNHVLYRVTPIFEGENLLASGVLIEGKSIEDRGEGILFCVYAYNVQPGIRIDYATGDSALSGEGIEAGTVAEETTIPEATTVAETTLVTEPRGMTYILNTNTKKFHYPSCSSVSQMKEKNKKSFTGSRDEIISQGYDPCGRCNP